MRKSENQIAVELIRYYQQKQALKAQEKTYNNPRSFVNLMGFYNEKINSLRTQLNGLNKERLQEIDTQRSNDCTVKGAVEFKKQSNTTC